MLYQDQPQGAEAISAADRRVTPQELVEAAAAIESYREPAVQSGDTIAIGDAVQQLGLNVTPDELWAEIQHKRTRLPASVTSYQRRSRIVRMALLASLVVALALAVAFLLQPPKPVMVATPSRTAIVGDVVLPAELFGRERLKLSEAIQYHIPIYVTLDDLRQLARSPEKAGGAAVKGWQKEFPIVEEYHTREIWRLFPLEDGLYVRGWHVKDNVFVLSSGRRVPLAKDNLFSQRIVADAEQASVPIRAFMNVHDPAYDLPAELHTDSGVVGFDGVIEGVNLPQSMAPISSP